jgi:hypothetical protein
MENLVYCDDINLCKNNYYYALASDFVPNPSPTLPALHTGIADSRTSGFYFAPGVPVSNYNPCAPRPLVSAWQMGTLNTWWPAPPLHWHPLFPQQQCRDMSCPLFPIPSSAWGHLLTKAETLSSPRQQSWSTTLMAIPSSPDGRMKPALVSGISPSRLMPQTLKIVPALQLNVLPPLHPLLPKCKPPLSCHLPHRSLSLSSQPAH